MCCSLRDIDGKRGLTISLFVAITFLVVGFLSRGYCPLEEAGGSWYKIFIHNFVFAIAIILLTSLLEVAGILLTSSTVGFTMFTCGRAIACSVFSASLVALLETIAYILAYMIALVKWRLKVVLAFIMLVVLLVSSIVESGAI